MIEMVDSYQALEASTYFGSKAVAQKIERSLQSFPSLFMASKWFRHITFTPTMKPEFAATICSTPQVHFQ